MAAVGAVLDRLVPGVGWIEGVTMARAERWTLYAVEPRREPERGADLFHGHRIRGQVDVEEGPLRRRLTVALNRGLAENGGWFGPRRSGLCFRPRHGIRAVRGGRTIDLLICFECYQVRVLDGPDRTVGRTLPVSGTPRGVFDEVYGALGLSIAPRECAPPGGG